jgi:hypothetical protein
MQRIRIGLVRSGCASGGGFQVYAGSGAGGIDWSHPITPRRQLFWPEAEGFAGHLLGGHISRRHLEAFCSDGHVQGTHLLDRALQPAAVVSFEAGPYVFGRFHYALVPEDAVGNPGEAVLVEKVLSSEPAGASRLLPTDCAADGRLVFTFIPSIKLTN